MAENGRAPWETPGDGADLVSRLRGLARGSVCRPRVPGKGFGAVLVGRPPGVAGSLTDRDLALAVLGSELDAKATSLGEVMSEEVITCDIVTARPEVEATQRPAGALHPKAPAPNARCSSPPACFAGV